MSNHSLHDYDPHSLSLEQARQRIQNSLTCLAEHEVIRLQAACGRTLASDIHAPINVPPHDYSAMDGYAFRASGSENFKVIGSSYAGHPYLGCLASDECVRIMTGALIPSDCDTVVMQEHVQRVGEAIAISQPYRAGQNIRRAGEDMRRGALILARGQVIRPAEMGVLAALGYAEVSVVRKLRVAFFSTGDELQEVGTPLGAGQIYDSNRYTLRGLLQQMEVDMLDMGCVRDEPDSLRTALLDAASRADVVLTSGGVSVGEADYIKQLLAEIGEVNFWKVAMKPGRPLAFGKIGACHFFGLPGNPVAVMVTFQQFVRDALKILLGQTQQAAFSLRARCISPIRKVAGRTEFQRGILSQSETGDWCVTTTGEQGSGILSSMSRANCFVVLDADAGDVAVGEMVRVEMF